MSKEINDLIRLLPFVIREKYSHYRDYIHDQLVDVALEEQLYEYVANVHDIVDLVFLLKLLYGLFVTGFNNYDQILDYFDKKQIEGFRIGRKDFDRNAEITGSWRALASDLERFVSAPQLSQYIKPGLSTDDVLRRILRSAKDDYRNAK